MGNKQNTHYKASSRTFGVLASELPYKYRNGIIMRIGDIILHRGVLYVIVNNGQQVYHVLIRELVTTKNKLRSQNIHTLTLVRNCILYNTWYNYNNELQRIASLTNNIVVTEDQIDQYIIDNPELIHRYYLVRTNDRQLYRLLDQATALLLLKELEKL